MYARYVPPSKASKAPEFSQSPTAAVTVSDSRPSESAARNAIKPKLVEEFSYARYVPAAKTKAKAIAETAPSPKPIQFFDDEQGSGTPKRKRDSTNEPQS
ncbi:hypothetical protein E4U22_006151, partial [Claviceps purpurea]